MTDDQISFSDEELISYYNGLCAIDKIVRDTVYALQSPVDKINKIIAVVRDTGFEDKEIRTRLMIDLASLEKTEAERLFRNSNSFSLCMGATRIVSGLTSYLDGERSAAEALEKIYEQLKIKVPDSLKKGSVEATLRFELNEKSRELEQAYQHIQSLEAQISELASSAAQSDYIERNRENIRYASARYDRAQKEKQLANSLIWALDVPYHKRVHVMHLVDRYIESGFSTDVIDQFRRKDN